MQRCHATLLLEQNKTLHDLIRFLSLVFAFIIVACLSSALIVLMRLINEVLWLGWKGEGESCFGGRVKGEGGVRERMGKIL